MAFVIISEIMLYLCFSILMGTFILSSIPKSYRPSLFVRKRYLIFAAIGVGLFSFTPVLLLIWNLQQRLGWQAGIQMVLLTFEIGKAWILTTIIVFLLLVYIAKFYQPEQSGSSWFGSLITILLIIGVAWSSHANSLEQGKGLLIHFAHFTAITVWVGIIYVVSWFSKNHNNWLRFLRWFTPLAIGCLAVTIASGFILMTFMVDIRQYPDALIGNYGQFLLIKHILIISLLIYAFINGILIRGKLIKKQNFNPVPWVRAESLFALLVFSTTAAMSQQSPPIASSLKEDGVSVLFELFYQGQYYPGMEAQLSINSMSILLFIIAFLFLILLFYAFLKKTSARIAFLLCALFSFSSYLAIILSVTYK